jgi:DNA-directed RNA polymerase delta subunit
MTKRKYLKKEISEKEAKEIAKAIIELKKEFQEIDREMNKAMKISYETLLRTINY